MTLLIFDQSVGGGRLENELALAGSDKVLIRTGKATPRSTLLFLAGVHLINWSRGANPQKRFPFRVRTPLRVNAARRRAVSNCNPVLSKI